MNYQELLERVLKGVDRQAYAVPTQHVDPDQRAAGAEFEAALADPSFDPETVKALVLRLHAQGRLDRVLTLSCLSSLAAHPRVGDHSEAARLAGEQEMAALDLGGPYLDLNLSAVDRHRGVLAFLRGHYEVALDYFSRALERHRSGENLGNVLCTLLRLGEEDEARDLLTRIRTAFPNDVVTDLEIMIQRDPDLALLRH